MQAASVISSFLPAALSLPAGCFDSHSKAFDEQSVSTLIPKHVTSNLFQLSFQSM
jgi:hypothetical protein